jgi:septal ring factor EnvC (AmiA/AmiB activator)
MDGAGASVFLIVTAKWLLAAAGAWLLATIPRAIIGEYAKRYWFSNIHPDEAAKAKREIADAKAKLQADQSEFNSFRDSLTTLVMENNALRDEVTRLKRENAKLILAYKKRG